MGDICRVTHVNPGLSSRDRCCTKTTASVASAGMAGFVLDGSAQINRLQINTSGFVSPTLWNAGHLGGRESDVVWPRIVRNIAFCSTTSYCETRHSLRAARNIFPSIAITLSYRR